MAVLFKKQFKVMSVGVCLALASVSPSQASDAAPGYISNIMVTPDGVVMFDHSGARGTLAGCHSATVPTRWAFNGATPAGQAKLSILLSAFAMNKRIQIAGLST